MRSGVQHATKNIEPLQSLIEAHRSRVPRVIQLRMLFNTAFADLTASCNSCHEALNHPYLVMKVPEVTGYGNQDFRALPGTAPAGAAAKK